MGGQEGDPTAPAADRGRATSHEGAPAPAAHSAFHFFIDRPVFGIVLSVLTTLVGVLALSALPVAQYPDVVPPQIVVTTQYPGASARTVAETGAREVHLRALGTVASAGGAVSAGYDDGSRSVTSRDVVAEVMVALGR